MDAPELTSAKMPLNVLDEAWRSVAVTVLPEFADSEMPAPLPVAATEVSVAVLPTPLV